MEQSHVKGDCCLLAKGVGERLKEEILKVRVDGNL